MMLQNERFQDLMQEAVQQYDQTYKFRTHLNDIENDQLNQIHDRYIMFKGQIRDAKNELLERINTLYTNYVNPERSEFWGLIYY